VRDARIVADPTSFHATSERTAAMALYFSPHSATDTTSEDSRLSEDVWSEVYTVLNRIISAPGFNQAVSQVTREIQHELIEHTGNLLPVPSPDNRRTSLQISEVYTALPGIFESGQTREYAMRGIDEICEFLKKLVYRLGGSSDDRYFETIPWSRMCAYDVLISSLYTIYFA
jgi:hypothetical protein